MSERVIITGVPGDARNRLEINTFVQNEKFFSLYIQALKLMYIGESQDAVRSFFQIGGIHGLPYKPWDDAPPPTPDPNDPKWGGYCTHGSVLFPTWHRPYVILFEQVMQQHAKKLAATYTTEDAADWVKAAEDIRQPYWDWATCSVPPDQVIALKQVTITKPDGSRISVDNPFFHYTFNPIESTFPSPYKSWPSTLRHPTSKKEDATDNIPALKCTLWRARHSYRSSTYNTLTRVHTWPAFSNHRVGHDNSYSNSIETIHNGIHNDVGGAGHMSNPGVAGFDPIFYLHHCNVDRMLSLWSALNPGVWVSPDDSAGVDQSTPLKPFRAERSSFWASSGVTLTARLGYTYPEFNGLGDDQNTIRDAITKIVNCLYGYPAAGVPLEPQAENAVAKAMAADTGAPSAVESERSVSLPLAAPNTTHEPHGTLVPPDLGLYEWTARIEFKNYELGCSFSVRIFIGDPPEDPAEWPVSREFVGAHHAFVNTAADQCSNCRNHRDLVEEGFVHLNWAIAARSGLGSFDPEVVEPYLTKELHWKVQKMDGTEAQLDSLEVSVYVIPLTYPVGSTSPVPGEGRRIDGITRGRRGGTVAI